MNFSVPFPADKYEALVFHAEEREEKIEDYVVGIRKYLDAKYEKEFGTPPGPLKIAAAEPEGSANIPSWES